MKNKKRMILPHHPDRSNSREKAIGYWTDTYSRGGSELPNPKDFVDESWDTEQRNLVINYLESGKTKHRWRGISRCRFCGKSNGSTCLSDGTYVWPSGFAHYLMEHGVKPSEEFIQHALKHARR